MHRVSHARRICETPLFGRVQDWLSVDPVWIESQAVNRPVVISPIKAPIARYGGLADVRERAQCWWNRAVVDEVVPDPELKQLHSRERICQIDVLPQLSGEIDNH